MLGTDFTTGSPIWLDLGSPDTAAAAAFYSGVFGWEHTPAGPDGADYGFFQLGGKTVAALGALTEEGADSAWILYFLTPDADGAAKTTRQRGGRVRAEPFDLPDGGRIAQLTDPGGAEFAVRQAAGLGGLEKTSEDNTLCWAELHAPDAAAAVDFYGALFGWRSQDMEAPGMTYRVLSTAEGDQQDTSFGGVAALQDGGEKARWIPYFAVADADETVARAQGSGGSVLMPAADVPDVGRIAWLADPFGAAFAVLKPAPGM
ncbi:VOC family protein [Streptomyces sp. NPDC008121]|uniref:VOC family protein n=1 Tax=Streptomyces sp. NPDC008121 TaxID=3364809 RepID=UPI0036E4AFC4